VLLAGSPALHAELVERLAATVDEDAITLMELEWFIRFRGFSVPEEPAERDRLLREVLEQMVNQWIVFRESEKTPFVQVTAPELDRYLEQYSGRFGGPEGLQAELRRLGFSMPELRELLRRQLAVNKFVELRFEPFVIVLPDEIRTAYESYAEELAREGQTAPPLELVEETLRQVLSVRKTTQQLEEWLEVARRRYTIQVLLFREPVIAPNLPEPYRSRVRLVDDPFGRASGSGGVD
jgi:hypothetical protein